MSGSVSSDTCLRASVTASLRAKPCFSNEKALKGPSFARLMALHTDVIPTGSNVPSAIAPSTHKCLSASAIATFWLRWFNALEDILALPRTRSNLLSSSFTILL